MVNALFTFAVVSAAHFAKGFETANLALGQFVAKLASRRQSRNQVGPAKLA